MEFRDHLILLRRHWKWIFISIPLALGLYFLMLRRQPIYSTSVKFYYRTFNPDILDEVRNARPAFETQPAMRPHLIESEEVLGQVAKRLEETDKIKLSVKQLKNLVSARVVDKPEIVEITARHKDKLMSVKIRETVKKVYIDHEIDNHVAILKEELKTLETHRKKLDEDLERCKASLKEKIEKSHARGLADPEMEAELKVRLITGLQQMLQANLMEAQQLEIQLKQVAEAWGRNEHLRRVNLPYPEIEEVDPAASGLVAELDSRELELKKLRKKYENRHFRVQEMHEEITELHERIRSHVRRSEFREKKFLGRQLNLVKALANMLQSALSDEYEEVNKNTRERDAFTDLRKEQERVQARIQETDERIQNNRELTANFEKTADKGVTILETRMPVEDALYSQVGMIIALSLAGAIAAMWLAGYVSPYLVTENDVRRYLNLPVLTTVLFEGRQGNQPLAVAESTPLWEVFSSLGLMLEGRMQQNEKKVLLFCSAVRGEGKTTVAYQTARTIARSGMNVLLIDADLRKDSTFPAGDNSGSGLGEFLENGETHLGLSDEAYAEKAMELVQGGQEAGLYLISSRKWDGSTIELLRSQNFHRLMEQYRASFDLVIIDTPAVNIVSDALYLARFADILVVVTASGQVRKEEVSLLKRRMDDTWSKVTGCVLNKAQTSLSGYYYYGYGGYYSYYDQSTGQGRSQRKARVDTR